MKKKLICMLLVLVMLSTVGCAAKSESEAYDRSPMEDMIVSSSNGIYYGATQDSEGMLTEDQAFAQNSKTENPAVMGQKLIRTMNITAETNDMDLLLGNLDAQLSNLGGYMESKSVRNSSRSGGYSYRYADLVIRVPADRLAEFVEHIRGESNVTSYQENADDITLTYVATESRVLALETEQTRLLELLAKADNMSDLLMIEQRLTEVRTELETVTSKLRVYDNLVDYGTVNLSVKEVQEYTVVVEETVWQRIGSGLKENWKNLTEGAKNLFVFLVVSVPYLIPVGAAAAVTVIAVKLAMKNTNKKTKKADPASEEKAE